MLEEHALLSEEFDTLGDDQAAFDDDDDLADEGNAEANALVDARLIEMREALDALRESEVSDALRRLRELFPHIPFPFRVHALMAARHQAVLG